jgi:hypothetical protein
MLLAKEMSHFMNGDGRKTDSVIDVLKACTNTDVEWEML